MVARRIAGTVALAVLGAAAAADEPELITDRPDQTESSAVVPPGRVQVEAGWIFAREDEGGVETDAQEGPATLARIGLADPVELRLGWAGFVSEEVETGGATADVDGPGDTGIGVKLDLWDEEGRRPDLALIAGVSLPTGDSEVTSDRVDPAFRFSASHTLGERVGLGYNLGLAWSTEADAAGERDTVSSFVYTAAMGFAVADRVGAFVELFGGLGGSAGGCPRHSLDGGFTWLVRDNVQLDASAGFGLSDAADDVFVGLGVSARFPR
jgi:hypothetical protein